MQKGKRDFCNLMKKNKQTAYEFAGHIPYKYSRTEQIINPKEYIIL